MAIAKMFRKTFFYRIRLTVKTTPIYGRIRKNSPFLF